MACITLIAPVAMATTQLARVIHYEGASTLHAVSRVERTLLRMSWVVATDPRRQAGITDAVDTVRVKYADSFTAHQSNIPLIRMAYVGARLGSNGASL